MSLAALTLDAAARKLRAREISSVELTEAVLERIAANDERIRAYITVDRGRALEQACAADVRLRAGTSGSPGGLIVAEDHLAALLLAADPGVAADLAASRLAPLADLPAGPRARLTETLAAWLDRPGQVQAVAAALGVHPQTVRYRVRQLRDLFGERLEDPEARFELSLALRVG